MRTILLIIFNLFFFQAFSQTISKVELAKLFNNGQYQKVIALYPQLSDKDKNEEMSYLLGLSYYRTEDYTNALIYLNDALEKGKNTADLMYHRGMSNFYLGRISESKKDLTKTILLEPKSSFYYKEKALIYFNNNEYDTAIMLLNTATTLEKPDDHALYLRGVVYADMGKFDEALYAYSIALDKMSEKSGYKLQTLYDMGRIEQARGNYGASNVAFLQIIEVAPTDFYSIQELVQNYHALGMHEEATKYKQRLYDGYNKRLLPPDINRNYCFEDFIYNQYHVIAYENYPGLGSLQSFEGFSKQIYNVRDTLTDKILFSVETKVIPEQFNGVFPPQLRYVLVKRVYLDDETEEVYYYWEYLFREQYTYQKLREAVNYVLDGNIPGVGFKPYWFDNEVELTPLN